MLMRMAESSKRGFCVLRQRRSVHRYIAYLTYMSSHIRVVERVSSTSPDIPAWLPARFLATAKKHNLTPTTWDESEKYYREESKKDIYQQDVCRFVFLLESHPAVN